MSTVRRTPQRVAVTVVYVAALLQGLTVVAFPASSTVLRSLHNLSDEGYGSLFIPQTVFTIVGSVLGGTLARKLGLRALLVFSALASVLSQLALLSVAFVVTDLVLPVLLVGTGLMGLGFGGAAAPLNTYPGLLFPARSDSALVALHTALGAGFSLGPVLVSVLVGVDLWVVFPAFVAMGSAVIGFLAMRAPLPVQASPEDRSARVAIAWGPLLVFGAVAVLYAFAEGTYSNWAAIYLNEARGVNESLAALSISGFWAALTVGRLVVAAVVARVPPYKVWLALPIGMAGVFLLLPYASGAASGIALFVLAGFACSAFFPLTVAIASRRFPGSEALVSSLLTAALMIGVGGGSFALGSLRRAASFDVIYRFSVVYPIAAFVLAALIVAANKRVRATLALEPRECV